MFSGPPQNRPRLSRARARARARPLTLKFQIGLGSYQLTRKCHAEPERPGRRATEGISCTLPGYNNFMAIRFLPLLFFVVLSLFSSSLSAVCDYVPFHSRSYRASALDVALDGSDLWVATSYGVMLYEAGPNPPIPRAGLAIPGTTNRVRVGTGVVYAASGSSIFVIRKEGRTLRNVRSLDLGATIHDLLFAAPYLYAATGSGVVQVDTIVPDAPRIATRLATTNGQAFSLARLDSTLYAADGDASIEAYSIAFAALPQKIGTVSSLPRSSQVLTTNNRLLVSDGIQTEIFAGSGTSLVRVGTLPTRAVKSVFPSAGDAAFVAGSDRTVRAIDLGNPSNPVTLFQFDLAPSPGTINRIEAMTGIAGRLYVAAGDIGLATFNTDGFGPPFPVRTYSESGLRSPIAVGSMVVAAGETGFRLFSVTSDGSLLSLGTWDTQQRSTAQDSEGTLLVTSSGRSVTLWDLSQQPPRQVSTVMLRATVRSAVLVDRTAVVLLDDKSVWKADLSQTAGTITQQTVAGAPTFLARSGTSVVLGEVSNEDGKTTLRYFGSADLAAEPRVVTLDGAATSGVALAGSTAAVITFRGISLIDFGAAIPAVRSLPSSASVIPRDLAFQNDTLFVLGPTSIQVWNTAQGVMQRTFDLGGDLTALAQRPIGGSILLAGESGLSSVQFQSATRLPSLVATYPNPNAFWKKLVVADSLLMLTDGRSIEVLRISDGRAPALLRRITPPSQIVDVTAVASTIYTLNVNRTVTGFQVDGSSAGEIRIDESPDVVPLGMRNVAGALWVSFTRGCATGACERRTIILDPRSGTLVQTTSFGGELKDFSQDGGRIVALFDAPAELRIFSVTNPFSPSMTGSRPAEGNPVSVAWSTAQRAVYALGEKLYVYDETSLTKSGELLGTYQSDPTGRVTYVDQKVRIHGGCAVVAGRSYSPQIFSITGPAAWTPLSTPLVPAAVKSIHIEGTTVYLLTDYSLEVWSTNPRPDIRRRAVR